MVYPTLEQVEEIVKITPCKRIPIKRELVADTVTPITVLRKLQNISGHCFMFESAEDNRQWGRYTFIGFDPSVEVTAISGVVQIKTDATTQTFIDKPATVIRGIIEENKAPILEGFPPFSGGLVGYFSYDYIKYAEPTLKLDAKDENHFKDMDLMLFDKLIAFDHYNQTVILIANIKTDYLARNYAKAELDLKQMADIVRDGALAPNPPLQLKSEFRALFDQAGYCNMVEKAKHYIHEGDIFQVVLSNRMEADMEGSLLDTYRLLRRTNPSPYMFYFSSEDVEIVGASPETLVKLQDGKLHTFPLAGTKPRGATQEEDEALERDLLSDEKERAEHNMLVDLGRNDIGRISKIGSVSVDKYMSIERFSHVMHIGSTVSGDIADGKDALDAIDSILPAGTLSGAPKLRACQIINALEDNKRGIYGGAIGYIDFTGNMDTCIAIRLAFSKNGKVFVRSGAGIVADSVAESEYNECINKAKVVVQSLEQAQGGIDL
ncbi:anthranilate synthase component I [Bengtsoniella intestinalis]|uniref:anthranilate synthase component I n=1 Tax=Bengtsoniella intestinalis TaxID=3073143 RepID=UPI00391F0888